MIFFVLLDDTGTKYDLDFKSPNKSGQNFKSGEDMIEMYKELCSGMSALTICLLFFIIPTILMFFPFSFSGGVKSTQLFQSRILLTRKIGNILSMFLEFVSRFVLYFLVK